MKRIMVFAPHPDDESIGCGGSIVKHAKDGNNITIVFFTSGKEGRETEAKNAAKILGVSRVEFLRFKDGFLSYSPEAVEKIVKLLEEVKPEFIYVPHEAEGDLDHQNAFKIVSEVLKKFYHSTKPTVLCYEVWTPIQIPNFYEDITDIVEIKKRAITMHKSQNMLFNFSKAALSLNAYRGVMSGKGDYCEAFIILKFEGAL
jgi:LmbE family N-acetylglucosaminyl deacetylase